MKSLALIFTLTFTINIFSEDVPYEKFYSNGQLSQKGAQRDGEAHGLIETYHENGLMKWSAYFDYGEYDYGTHFTYYPNGKLKEKKEDVNYRNWAGVRSGRRLNGLQEGYYPSGNIAYRGNIKTIKLLPRFDGPFEQFDEGGRLWKKSNIDRGEYHGKEEFYYRSGTVWALRNYSLGKEQGPYKKFFENGNIWEKGNIKKGEVEGRMEIFNRNGKIIEINLYKKGLLHGVTENYWSNGQIRSSVNFKKHVAHGIGEYFDRKGKLQFRVKHDGGKLFFQTVDGNFVHFNTLMIEKFKLPKDFFYDSSPIKPLNQNNFVSRISELERITRSQIASFMEAEKFFAMAREDNELVKAFELRIRILRGTDEVDIKEEIDFTLSSLEKRIEFEENNKELTTSAKALYVEGLTHFMKGRFLVDSLTREIQAILPFVMNLGMSRQPIDPGLQGPGLQGLGLKSTRQLLEKVIMYEQEIPEFFKIVEIAFMSLFTFSESRELVYEPILSSEL